MVNQSCKHSLNFLWKYRECIFRRYEGKTKKSVLDGDDTIAKWKILYEVLLKGYTKISMKSSLVYLLTSHTTRAAASENFQILLLYFFWW